MTGEKKIWNLSFFRSLVGCVVCFFFHYIYLPLCLFSLLRSKMCIQYMCCCIVERERWKGSESRSRAAREEEGRETRQHTAETEKKLEKQKAQIITRWKHTTCCMKWKQHTKKQTKIQNRRVHQNGGIWREGERERSAHWDEWDWLETEKKEKKKKCIIKQSEQVSRINPLMASCSLWWRNYQRKIVHVFFCFSLSLFSFCAHISLPFDSVGFCDVLSSFIFIFYWRLSQSMKSIEAIRWVTQNIALSFA